MRDVAVGLNYLHCLPEPTIHCDVSSARQKYQISDQATTGAVGAIVYSAPEPLQVMNQPLYVYCMVSMIVH